MLRLSLWFFSGAILFNSSALLAHSEHDKARFVAKSGTDAGKCDQVLRPCKTIAYAVKQANKGDRVLVSSGEYIIDSSEELFYLKSALVPILGGYNRFDHFQSQSPATNITSLRHIPGDMAETLRQQGFSVLADGKSLLDFDSPESKALKKKLASYQSLSKKQTELDCVDGYAGNFPCNNIDLLAHMPLSDFSSRPSAANDIWGHVDLNTGDEYALIGLRNGVAVVNVTDPTNPVEVGTVSGKSSSWRDIKVYQYFDENLNAWQAYAYATIDNAIDYVTIINLNQLPHTVSLQEKNQVIREAHNVYISNVDRGLNIALPNLTPSLQLIGSNKFSGAFHSYSLATPSTLTALSDQYFGSGYTHDGASLNITDARKDNQCSSSEDSCTVFIDFNEKEMKLWDITDINNTTQLGSAEYNDVNKEHQYVHSGWGTEDKQFIFLHDEFDEKYGGLNSTVRIFSIADLSNPQQVGQWTGPTRAIDHNGFVRGNRYYMSNYERGLTILDISQPENPLEVGFFDTFTPSNNAGFNGAWGAYPFLPSGNILVSDIGSGLYILRDGSRDSAQGRLGFSTKNIAATQGQPLTIPVQRTQASDASNAVTVNYEILPGSAKEQSDYTPISGQLQWSANDTSDKTLSIDIAADTTGTEFEESFFVRLSQPSNSATLGDNSYITVNVEGLVDSGSLTFTDVSLVLAENQAQANISVARLGNTTGEVSVTYQLQSGSAIVGEDIMAASGTLTWADGDNESKIIALTIINDELIEDDENFTITLAAVDGSRLGDISEISATISDDDSNTAPSVSLAENFQANAGASVTIQASATDSENDVMSYLWQQTSGTAVSLNNATSLNANFIAPSTAGNLAFTFSATDSKGAVTSSNITVTVVAAPTKKSSSGGGALAVLLVLLALLATKKYLRLTA